MVAIALFPQGFGLGGVTATVGLVLDLIGFVLLLAFVLISSINGTVAGSVGGTMVGVLAVCRRRRIGVLGHIHLREPRAEFVGVASELSRQAADMQERVESFARRIAVATGRPFEHVEADLRSGLHLDAAGALAYGLANEIVGPK